MSPSEAEDQVLDGSQPIEEEEGSGYSFNMAETDEDAGFEAIPTGTYGATIEALEFTMSKSSGAPMWNVTYALTDGEWAEKNRKLFGYVSFKKEQLGRAKQYLKRVAPELSELVDFNPQRVAEEGLMLGKQVRLRVGIQTSGEYKGRNQIKDVLAAGSGGGSEGGASGGDFAL